MQRPPLQDQLDRLEGDAFGRIVELERQATSLQEGQDSLALRGSERRSGLRERITALEQESEVARPVRESLSETLAEVQRRMADQKLAEVPGILARLAALEQQKEAGDALETGSGLAEAPYDEVQAEAAGPVEQDAMGDTRHLSACLPARNAQAGNAQAERQDEPVDGSATGMELDDQPVTEVSSATDTALLDLIRAQVYHRLVLQDGSEYRCTICGATTVEAPFEEELKHKRHCSLGKLRERLNEPVDVPAPTNSARLVAEIEVTDPDSKSPVSIAIFKHNESGGMFATDASFLDQCFDDNADPVIPDPLNEGCRVKLLGM